MEPSGPVQSCNGIALHFHPHVAGHDNLKRFVVAAIKFCYVYNTVNQVFTAVAYRSAHTAVCKLAALYFRRSFAGFSTRPVHGWKFDG